MRTLRENLFVQFSAISFVVIAIVAVTLILFLSNASRSQAVTKLTDDAKADVSERVITAITPLDLEVPMTGERYDKFHKFVQESIVSRATARVKLWARDGTVIYSGAQESVGTKFPDNENLLKALNGETATEIKLPEGLEDERERFLGTLIEVYTPIVFPGTTEPQGVLEIYRYYEPTAQLIDEQRNGILMMVGLGFVVLYGALVSIVWRSWRTIVRQRKERKQAEEEKESIQSQLRQSQKMEAVGRLAGGVAHDFNNLLTVMTVCSHFLLDNLRKDDPNRQDVEEIRKATERATALTRQLLAFSRRQVLELEVLNINSILADMDKMMRLLIGEDVHLEYIPEPKLDSVRADRGSIEQVIMNLIVNSRDAMPNGGTNTIRTQNVTLNDIDCRAIREAKPGRFVRLSVTDTGTGIDPAILEHLFEPFFTTKAKGKGTGLGLSTVYGIAKQYGGWVNVYSEPGQGATFRVYLPAHTTSSEGENKLTEDTVSGEKSSGNGAQILLVEDDESIRMVAQRLLTENGYLVSPAKSAEEAMSIFEIGRRDFQLVISDVVLPDKSGIELASQLLALQPELNIVLSSGYTEEKAQLSAIREKGHPFIQKPYTTDKLLRIVRENVHSEQGKSTR